MRTPAGGGALPIIPAGRMNAVPAGGSMVYDTRFVRHYPNGEGLGMAVQAPHPLADLYLADETAWLEQSAALIRAGRLGDLDPGTLAEYLTDMARRDRREVLSRLVVLLVHLLKWDHQPERQSGSWRATIREQRRVMGELIKSGTLRNHAEAVLVEAYTAARLQAIDETGLDAESFPAANPWTLDDMIRSPDH